MDALNRRTYGQLAAALAESSSITETVDLVVRFAVETLGTAFGGVTLIDRHGRSFETVGATHKRVVEADLLQHQLQEGPSIDASVTSRSLMSADLAADRRWPRWGPAAAELGFTGIISAELHARGHWMGALNVYGARGTTFTEADLESAQLFAYQASIALGYARIEEGLIEAVRSRTVIGQAQGILMNRFSIDADRAFAVLRRFSQDSNRRLRDIAEELVENGGVLPADMTAVSVETAAPGEGLVPGKN